LFELSDVKLIATEKTSEVVVILKRFKESQGTTRETDLMLNALLRVNETIKCDIE